MQNSSLAIDNESVKQQIILAAETRFSHYGYQKTTMSEISGDVGMSAANLYRYFQNKEDIMAACAKKYADERIARLNEIISDPADGAVEKLNKYALTTLQFSHELAHKNNKTYELIDVIKNRRPEIIHYRVGLEILLIKQILEQGQQSGVFRMVDIEDTARAIHTSLIVFDLPIFMNLYSLEEFEEMAKSTVRLLINGIK